MRFLFLTSLFSLWLPLRGQVQDNFSDGDFSQNPSWIGETSFFQVSPDFQLQSNGPTASDTLYLSTANALIDSAEWQFRLSYGSAPSGSNRLRVYLVADQADLEGPLNGYFLAVGEGGSNDSYDLFRQDGDNLSLLIDGIDGLAGAEIDARIRVRRDELGNWSLEVDPGNTGTFQAQGVIQDLTHSSTSSIGVWVKHTSTRANDFFFDDFYVGPYQIDNQPPLIDTIEVLDSNQLRLLMNEGVTQSSAEEDLNYLLLPGTQIPALATRSVPNPAEIILDWQVAFQDNQTYQLIVNQLVDFSGNVMTAADTIAFLVDLPDVAVAKDIVIHEIMADPSPAVGLPEVEYLEILNRSTKTFDLTNWVLEDNTSAVNLPPYQLGPGELVVLAKEDDAVQLQSFGPALGVPSFPTLTNSGEPLILISPEGLTIDSLQYSLGWYNDPEKDNGGFSLELIRPEQLDCPDAANWTASVAQAGGTPGTSNSVFDPNPDTQVPLVSSVTVLSSQLVEVCFDQSMDATSLAILSNYSLPSGLGNPNSIQVIEPDLACVQLGWGSSLPVGISLALDISGLLDCQGSALNDTTLQIVRGIAPQAFEVIINEFLFDFSPAVGLPEAEFIEVYNRSNQILDLGGYLLADASGSVELPAGTLLPNEYAVICDVDDQAAFEAFGKVLAVEGLPNLNSDTDSIRLTGPNGEVVDYVFYADDWITDEDKANGGWSLERIDPNLLDCNQASNWAASKDPRGGTPGSQNSRLGTYSDNEAPSLLSWELTSPQQILLHFSEPLDAITPSPNGFVLTPGGIAPNSLNLLGADRRSLRLNLPVSLDSAVVYTLNWSGVGDCLGNEAEGTLLVGIPREPMPFEIVFSEIFADPTPPQGLPEVEYLEIHNRTDRLLDVSGLELVVEGAAIEMGAHILPPRGFLILVAERNAELFFQLGPVIPLSSLPALGNSGDRLAITKGQEFIDYVLYDRDWWETDKQEGGWALEKLDLDQIDCNQPGNWGASEAAIGGTPGQANSRMEPFVDNEPPTLEAVVVFSPSEIQLRFSEQMDLGTLWEVNNYELSGGIGNPIVPFTEGLPYQIVNLLFDQEMVEGQIYDFLITGLTDCEGNEFSDSIQVGIPQAVEAGDVLINEVLFNPYTGGADFVEIANVSNKVLNVSSLLLGEVFPETDSVFNQDPVSEIGQLLLPGDLLCLTADVPIQQTTYLPPESANFLEMESFPSYDDARGEVALLNLSGAFIDRFAYEDDYHFPSLIDDNGVSLERISLQRPTQQADNWQSAASTVGFATPGYQNSQAREISTGSSSLSLDPATFSPNSDGSDDVLGIHYEFSFQGANARVEILDRQGRRIRLLQENVLLSPEPGSFFWDGTDDRGNRAPIGPYIVVLEVSRADTGERLIFREVCVLADRF